VAPHTGRFPLQRKSATASAESLICLSVCRADDYQDRVGRKRGPKRAEQSKAQGSKIERCIPPRRRRSQQRGTEGRGRPACFPRNNPDQKHQVGRCVPGIRQRVLCMPRVLPLKQSVKNFQWGCFWMRTPAFPNAGPYTTWSSGFRSRGDKFAEWALGVSGKSFQDWPG